MNRLFLSFSGHWYLLPNMPSSVQLNTCADLYSRSEVKWKSLHHVWLFATPGLLACQAPLSVEFSRPSILGWVAIPFFRASTQPKNGSQVSRIAGRLFTVCVTRETLHSLCAALFSSTGLGELWLLCSPKSRRLVFSTQRGGPAPFPGLQPWASQARKPGRSWVFLHWLPILSLTVLFLFGCF